MPIELVDAKVDDLLQIAQIESAAFATSSHSPILFPGPASPEMAQTRAERILDDWKKDPGMRLTNAVDSETGEIMACSRWHLYLQERPESEWMKDDVPEEWGPGANGPACVAFFGKIHESRKRIMAGRPHLLLSVLVTHPDHQGKGAASALLQWGNELSDRHHIPAYLESTPVAHSVYQKAGYEDVDAIVFSFKDYSDKDGSVKITNMIRHPKQKV